MNTKKITTILAVFLLTTGIALAQPADIPEPGLTPESPFYALEKASERLELAVAQAPVIGSEKLEAKVRANHAAETLAEARAMAEKNNTEQVERLMNRYSENMNRSISSAGRANRSELSKRLDNVTNNQNQALRELEEKVPPQARKGVQNAIDNNRKNQVALGRPEKPGGSAPSDGQRSDNAGREQGTGQEAGNRITGRSTSPPSKPNGQDQSQRGNQTSRSDTNTQNTKPQEREEPNSDLDSEPSQAGSSSETARQQSRGGR